MPEYLKPFCEIDIDLHFCVDNLLLIGDMNIIVNE